MKNEEPLVQLLGDERIWLMHSGQHESGEHGAFWPSYLRDGFVGIAGEIQDIRTFEDQEGITKGLERLGVGEDRNARPTQTALAYHQFAHEMAIGDLVMMRSHSFFVGVGRVDSAYSYDDTSTCKHFRKITWLAQGQTPMPKGWNWKKLTDIGQYSRGNKGITFGYQGWIELANKAFFPAGQFPTQTWWVNQGDSFNPENPQIWAPATQKDGRVNKYHRFVQDIRRGDLIVHYNDTKIRGFSIAQHDAESRANPFDDGSWNNDGFGLDVTFHPCDPISLKSMQSSDELFTEAKSRKNGGSPFNSSRGVIQGYMFPFGLSMLDMIQRSTKASLPSPIQDFLRGFQNRTEIPQAMPINKIFYGPPGTGKTYRIQKDLIGAYQAKSSDLSREELLEQFASDLTWAEAIGIALLELKEASVLEILNHEVVGAKARVSSSKSPRHTIWGRILAHVHMECPEVKVTVRQSPLFWKHKNGNRSFFTFWDGLDEQELGQFESLTAELRAFEINNKSTVSNQFEFVTFHQSFSYEDFVEGIKPVMDENEEGQLAYAIQKGVFKKLCERAHRKPEQRFAIFIDEINRGNVASIFGELITLIEPDKREGQENELSVTLPYSKEKFSVPSNLDIYGTMNTADRSVEALDTALRRRFEFEEIGPNWQDFDGKIFDGVNVGTTMRTINQRIEHLLDKDHCIGHSYFYKVTDFQSLQQVFAKNILPLLQEYFYGDFGKVGLILGDAFVQVRNERQTSFASFDHPDADLLQEKVVYHLKDPTAVKPEGYRAIYLKENA